MVSQFDDVVPGRPRKSRRRTPLGVLILLIAGVVGVIAEFDALTDAS